MDSSGLLLLKQMSNNSARIGVLVAFPFTLQEWQLCLALVACDECGG